MDGRTVVEGVGRTLLISKEMTEGDLQYVEDAFIAVTM